MPSSSIATSFFEASPITALERKLQQGDIVPLMAGVSRFGAIVDALVPLFSEHLGVDLSPTKGRDTFRAIDRLVAEHRPAAGELDDDAVFPLRVLVGLGLVAVQTARTLRPEAQVYSLDDASAPRPVSNLLEAGGFPGLLIGPAGVNLSQKVLKRWLEGPARGHSVDDLWSMVIGQIGEPTPERSSEETSEVLEALKRGLAPDLAPGSYQILVGLYEPVSGARLQLAAGGDSVAIPLEIRP